MGFAAWLSGGLQLARYGVLFPLCILLLNGCAGTKTREDALFEAPAVETEIDEKPGEVRLSEFYLSPGDEINISVFQHNELNKKIKIPPDGRFFYPIVGEIDAKGKTLRKLRDIVVQGLSNYNEKEHILHPGDEISIAVYQHSELDRKITIPPGGVIFFPLVGEIDTTGKTLRETRNILLSGLSQYNSLSLIPGDEILITVFRHDELTRKIIIPPDGYIFYPLVGEINTAGKTLREIRQILSDGLSKYFRDVQVEANLTISSKLKLIFDPQVSIELANRTGQTSLPSDPQVSIEATSFGGQKVFVLGEVKTPGVFLSDGNTSVVEAVAMAGGFTLDAKKKNLLIIRKSTEHANAEVTVVNMMDTLTKGSDVNLDGNMRLLKGDIVYVPRTFIADVDRFFMHLANIINPLLSIETGYYIGTQIENSQSAIIAR